MQAHPTLVAQVLFGLQLLVARLAPVVVAEA
jgi:hypothetical protein